MTLQVLNVNIMVRWIRERLARDNILRYKGSTLRKKWSQNGSTSEAVSWYVTQLHYVRNSSTLVNGAILAPVVDPFSDLF